MRDLLTLSLIAVAAISNVATCKDRPDPRMATVSAVFVAGNNQAAEKARETLRSAKTCLSLAMNADGADATLEIAAESQSMGGGFGGFGGRTWIVSGNLTLKSGDLIWSRSERFSDDPLRSGGKIAGSLLVRRLADDAGCRQRDPR
ncbi:MAG TPA: hypothetical protein VN924_27490 [Bryobacteraceae bacterium]|nr:hypothetical protein [Bryobacteraceae bacterium]